MKITFTNFRCLKQTDLTLSPLTVIAGPNASGKSSIVRALDPDFVGGVTDIWQRRPGLEMMIERRFLDNRIILSGCKSTGQPYQDFNGEFAAYTYQYLQLDVKYLRSFNVSEEERRLSPTGGNLTNVFMTLTRSVQTQLAQEFCRLVPVFSDVVSTPAGGGKHRLRFADRWNSSTWYEPEQVSDGSLLILAFLVLQYQQPPVDILAIEEPEHSLHPYLVGEVVQLLRQLAHGGLGPRKISVVLTTHSPEVLRFVEPEEARFLTRQEDGSAVITKPPAASPAWEQAFEEYGRHLGSAWLSGGLGGVPSG